MDITIRFNEGRMVAVFDNQADLNTWLGNNTFNQEFMYTIHGLDGVKDLNKYRKTL